MSGQVLGSFQSITDEDGDLIEKLSFDPWGRRRNANDWTFNNVPNNYLFDRGYTGHEHLDQLGVINMNGRVGACPERRSRFGNPTVARFLSPDPFVQNPSSTQGFNRYSYVSNNPLKFTDPSGFYMQKMIENGTTLAGYYLSNSMANGHIGPGSGNHWSDQYRGEQWNFMLMNSNTFDNTYGGGSYDKAVALYDFGGALTQSWSAGDISLANVSLLNLEWNKLGGAEVMRNAYTENGTSYLDIFYEGSWTSQKNQNAAANQLFGGINGSSGRGVDATPYVGGALGVGSEVMFSNKFGTWLGKDGKIRSQNWGGNGTTGGKFKFAGKMSKGFKIGGWVSGAYGMYATNTEWQNNKISTGQMMIEQGSNILGFIPTYGTAWSIGWNLGQDFGPSTWYGKNDNKWFE